MKLPWKRQPRRPDDDLERIGKAEQKLEQLRRRVDRIRATTRVVHIRADSGKLQRDN